MDKAAAFGKPSPDKLYGEPITVMIDGTEYRMNRIRIADISAVYGRIRDNRIAAVLRHYKSAPQLIMSQAIAYTGCIDPTQEDYWNYAQTPAGMVYILWRCLSPLQPRLTEDDVAQLVEKEGGLKDILFAESGITEPEKEKRPEGENCDPLAVFGQSSRKETGPKQQDG